MWLLACAFDPAQSPAWDLAGHPGCCTTSRCITKRQCAGRERSPYTFPLPRGGQPRRGAGGGRRAAGDALATLPRFHVRDERRAGMFREAKGFASGTFTIAKADGQLSVAGIDGPQKRRRAPPVAPQSTRKRLHARAKLGRSKSVLVRRPFSLICRPDHGDLQAIEACEGFRSRCRLGRGRSPNGAFSRIRVGRSQRGRAAGGSIPIRGASRARSADEPRRRSPGGFARDHQTWRPRIQGAFELRQCGG